MSLVVCVPLSVGRLAPQIGDYDLRSMPSVWLDSSRKTCPTNRGLRRVRLWLYAYRYRRKTCPTNRGLRLILMKSSKCQPLSEDLPHKSGITTLQIELKLLLWFCRKTCPTNRGLRLMAISVPCSRSRSEDLPHKSGITT